MNELLPHVNKSKTDILYIKQILISESLNELLPHVNKSKTEMTASVQEKTNQNTQLVKNESLISTRQSKTG